VLQSLIHVFAFGMQAGFNSANTASVAWAYASSGRETEDVLSAVEERVWQLGMQGFDEVQIVLLVWALASTKYVGPSGNHGKDTLSMVEIELRKRKIKNMPDDNLATIVWAFSRLAHPGGGGLVRVQKELLKRGWLDPQKEGKFSWSLTNRRQSRRPTSSKAPHRPPQPIQPDGVYYGLQQMGIPGAVEVVVGGGCWAVEGMGGSEEAASRSAEQGFGVEENSGAMHGAARGDGSPAAYTWARPCAH
jgi:hypothetical protein